MMSDMQPRTAQQLFAPGEVPRSMRERILSAALDCFYTHGFHAVGLDQIIRHVGTTKTTFYNHFESKDELILEAIRTRDRWEADAFARAVGELSDGTPRGDVLAWFDALDRWFNDPDYGGCLFITACAEFPSPHDPVHRAAANHYANGRAVLRDVCRRAGVDDPEALADQVVLVLKGAVIARMITGDNGTARHARAVVEALLEGHCPGFQRNAASIQAPPSTTSPS